MLHYTFLWQVLGMLVGFGSFIIVLQNYRSNRNNFLILFLLSIFFTFIRTLIFTIHNYSKASRAGILSFHFDRGLTAGFLYVLLIALASYFLIRGLCGITGLKFPLWLSILYWIYYSSALLLYLLLMMRWRYPAALRPLFTFRIIADIPFYTGKILLLVIIPFLIKRNRQAVILILILLAIQLADALIRLYPDNLTISLPLYFILPGAAYMIILPGLLGKKKTEVQKNNKTERIAQMAARFRLNSEEAVMLAAVLEGKSNKEIAWEQNVSLSIIKHRLYRIYRKCGVSSRWEIFAKADE